MCSNYLNTSATIHLSQKVRLHFQGFPGLGYGRRVFLQAVLTGAQNTISEINIDVHFLKIYAERFPIHFGQTIPKRQQPIICEVPIAQREILEDAKAVRYFLLNSNHTVNKSIKSDFIFVRKTVRYIVVIIILYINTSK